MAETVDESTKPEKSRPRAELWVLAALAGGAILCVSLLAVALALILGKGSLIQVNPVISAGAPAAPAAAAPAPSIQRPSQQVGPLASRSSAQDQIQPALPGALATPTPVAGRREANFVRSDAAVAPPSAPFPTPGAPGAGKAAVPVRVGAATLYNGDHALPMPVHHSDILNSRPLDRSTGQGPAQAAAALPGATLPGAAAAPVSPPLNFAPAGATPVSAPPQRAAAAPALEPPVQPSAVAPAAAAAAPAPAPARASASVAAAPAGPQPTAPVPAASAPVAAAPLAAAAPPVAPAAAPATPATVPATGGPGDAAFAPGQCLGTAADLHLLDARSTALLNGTPAPQGNRYFAARVQVTNKGGAVLNVDSGAFDLRDADGNSYMADPAADASQVPAPLKPGASGEIRVSFPVPDDVVLRSLALVLASETDLIPLVKK